MSICDCSDMPSRVLGGKGPSVTDSIEAVTPQADERELAEQLVEQARAGGAELIGRGGLPTGLMSQD